MPRSSRGALLLVAAGGLTTLTIGCVATATG
ncbi:MAG: hypothetical protein QOD70_1673, partial [Frankiales bacterium]|nr:hypothetical protein [Frankiales bacterium]